MNDQHMQVAIEELLIPNGLNLTNLQTLLDDLRQANIDFGDLYLQKTALESWVLDDRLVKKGAFSIDQGASARAICSDQTGFAYSNQLTDQSLKKLIHQALAFPFHSQQKAQAAANQQAQQQPPTRYYATDTNFDGVLATQKVEILQQIDAYARQFDTRVDRVNASLAASYEIILIMSTDGICVADVRPLVRLSVSVIVAENNRREQFSSGAGGRYHMNQLLDPSMWQAVTRQAVEGAVGNLSAEQAPSGQMPVVLGNGWSGVLLHEAVGHGLEGDFNRKEVSKFSQQLGQKVLSDKCTIIDDGTIPNRRGSLSVDDEGMLTQKNVLVEQGVLQSYMHDRISANAFDVAPTGNGRRESYAYLPMPRMTNTYLAPGNDRFEAMIESIDDGIYATHFNGGQVDITSGQFVFVMDQAYRIKNGKIQAPVKNASLIGNGIDVMQQVSMVGSDLDLDPGIGTCGKEGQSVPVGVGQPSLKIDQIVVGGTA